jgi:hypothetical protein
MAKDNSDGSARLSAGAQIVSFAAGRERLELLRKEQKAEAMREAFRLARGETDANKAKLAGFKKKRRNKKPKK